MGPTTHGVKTRARPPGRGRPRWPDWPGRDPDASATPAHRMPAPASSGPVAAPANPRNGRDIK